MIPLQSAPDDVVWFRRWKPSPERISYPPVASFGMQGVILVVKRKQLDHRPAMW